MIHPAISCYLLDIKEAMYLIGKFNWGVILLLDSIPEQAELES